MANFLAAGFNSGESFQPLSAVLIVYLCTINSMFCKNCLCLCREQCS